MALATSLERFRLYVAVRGTLQVEGHRALARVYWAEEGLIY